MHCHFAKPDNSQRHGVLLHSHTSYTMPVTTCNPAACTDMFNENTPAGSQHHKHNKTC